MNRSSNIRNRPGRALLEKGIAWIELGRQPSVNMESEYFKCEPYTVFW